MSTTGGVPGGGTITMEAVLEMYRKLMAMEVEPVHFEMASGTHLVLLEKYPQFTKWVGGGASIEFKGIRCVCDDRIPLGVVGIWNDRKHLWDAYSDVSKPEGEEARAERARSIGNVMMRLMFRKWSQLPPMTAIAAVLEFLARRDARRGGEVARG